VRVHSGVCFVTLELGVEDGKKFLRLLLLEVDGADLTARQRNELEVFKGKERLARRANGSSGSVLACFSK